MAKRNYHIVHRKDQGKWAVIAENKEKANSLHDTQREAIERGRKLAVSNRSELVIYGRDGKIRDKDNYGKDPFPPRDIAKIKEKMKTIVSERKSVHVIPQKDRWAVVKEGETLKAYGTFSSKQDAITRARDLAQKGDRNAVIIHRRDATVEKWEEISDKAAK